jgi:hypothetical protein
MQLDLVFLDQPLLSFKRWRSHAPSDDHKTDQSAEYTPHAQTGQQPVANERTGLGDSRHVQASIQQFHNSRLLLGSTGFTG